MLLTGPTPLEWLLTWSPRLLQPNCPPPDEDCRGWFRYASDVPITCQLANALESRPISARLKDISVVGLSLRARHPFEPGTLLQVELPHGISALARVLHATPRSGGIWRLGCVFIQELGAETLRLFRAQPVRSNLADQRTWVRFPCDVRASYHLVRAGQPKPWAARVVNISAGGLYLLASAALDVGAIVQLTMGDAGSLLACAVHVSTVSPGTWGLGCTFLRELSDQEFQTVVG
jgi:hypothetical protein